MKKSPISHASLCFFCPACAFCWGGAVPQQLVGSILGPVGSCGGALPPPWAQCRRLASVPKHGSLWLGGFQFPPAARLLHGLHLWLVGLVRVGMPAKQMYEEVDEFGENSFLSLVFPTGLRCRRLELHWIMPWRISPWFSIVHNYLRVLSWLTLHSSSSASAFICFVKEEVRRVSQDQGLNVVNIPAALRNAVLGYSSQEFDLFIPLNWI